MSFGRALGHKESTFVLCSARWAIITCSACAAIVGVAKKLIAAGIIPANDSAVLCVTGNGLKTMDAINGHVGHPREIKPSLREFEALVANEETPARTAAR